MTVIINESVIAVLLESQDGPVGRFVARKAEQVTAEAQRNVRGYFASAPALDVDQDVGFNMEGSTATIGIRDAGSKSRRLAQSQADGRINWLRSALDAARE